MSIRLRLSDRCFGYGSGAVAMCGHGQMEPVWAMAMAVMVVVASGEHQWRAISLIFGDGGEVVWRAGGLTPIRLFLVRFYVESHRRN